MIEIVNVSKSYDKKSVLKDIDLKIEKNMIYGLVGTNGAGKTTLLKIIAQLLKPNDGEVIFDSNNKVSFVPDNASLYEYLTGQEYLLFSAAMFEIPKDTREKIVSDLLKLFNLEEAKHKLIQTYSNGMKQKVSIASAIISDPDMIILDEPLTGVDLINSKIIRSYIQKFSEKGIVIISTHLLELAHSLCDKIGILHNGTIVDEFICKEMSLSEMEHYITTIYLDKETISMTREV
ncbi:MULTISPECIES: ABC transporter ATP-binding protein [Bacillus]|uniref:ABC transporter ATP-binding protein n=1 Tax=Bacillus TaxID=1386 RepID=UPI0011A6F387|nr:MULTISPECIES: ABC transporter ATP-binding protein [Bacillus]MDI0275116.1 ABC transporter ATP-binding protein [Bacillus safensis]QRY36299.1 ABC transporter ATP-binding protein [Bacillus sp. PDNC022]